ncbi:MAG: heme ABC transporter substrate-binding protein IsdE [Oribacterium sp.]
MRSRVRERKGERAARRFCAGAAAFFLGLLLLSCGARRSAVPVPGDGTAASAEVDGGEPRLAATSMSIVEICDKLDLPLVGVPESNQFTLPERYQGLRRVGAPMSPDPEILADLAPDYVLSPLTLRQDLQEKYEKIGVKYLFLNLKSVPSMYKSVEELGTLFHREQEAERLLTEFRQFYQSFRQSHIGKEGPSVLILMGLPGAYVIATENSYCGSLVELAGGRNVYSGTDKDFLNGNTEDMLKRDPDVILRTAHAMPEEVMQMFDQEFRENDIWRHFRAVKENRVYDLPSECFGMSAKFNYQEAEAYLDTIFYGGE